MEETITITRQILILTFIITFLLGISFGMIMVAGLWFKSTTSRIIGG